MSRKIHNYESVVLVDETIEEFGYHPDKYGKASAKFIVARCRVCGEPHKIRKGFYNKSGSACHKQCKIEEMKQQKSPFLDVKVREKSKKTNLERYGFEQASSNKEIGKKISFSKLSEDYKGIDLVKQDDKSLKKNLRKVNKQKKLIVDSIKEFYFGEILLKAGKIIKPYELDIYIPENKFAIEFNGSYWHSEAILDTKEARNKHISKTRLCREKGIRLFHIFEYQWDTRREQLLNFIRTILSKNVIKVAGRKCEVSSDECKEFFNANHIQGYGQGTKKYFNLVYEGKIVASMTASRHHRQGADSKSIVLNRLCFDSGVNVQGGSSKLFKYFKEWAKNEGYDKIISWSDNCWTEGNIYKVLGFDLVKEYDPDYFYWDIKSKKYLSKQSQKKSNSGCLKETTEREWSIDKGLFRIWDTGKRLWEYNL